MRWSTLEGAEVEGAALAARVSSEIGVDVLLQVSDKFFGQSRQSGRIDSYGESGTAREYGKSFA